MDPTPHLGMPRILVKCEDANFTNIDFGTSGVRSTSTWSCFHSSITFLLVRTLAFWSFNCNQTKGSTKTFVFMDAWSWHLGPSCWVDGWPSLPCSINKMMSSIKMPLEQLFCCIRDITCTHLACEPLPNDPINPFLGYPSGPSIHTGPIVFKPTYKKKN
jgi:hypothetical protein